jgi:Leucine-rich repeat (LRR) protein
MVLILPKFQIVYTLAVTTICYSLSAPASPCLLEQASALLELKNSFNTTGGNSTIFQSWVAGTDCCSWDGVLCSRTDGRVTSLDLGDCQLEASVLDPALFKLTSLKHLNLSGNDFNMSQLPATGFERLTELTHLDLSDTNFAGFVPAGISRLKELVYLDLSTSFDVVDFDNENRVIYYTSDYFWQLSVPNLETLLADITNLEELHLGMVNLSTNTRWCDTLAKYNPKLQVLSLPYCLLSGPICGSLSSLKSLAVVDLHYNHMSGSVPEFLAEMSNLRILQLSKNKFEGPFPTTIFQNTMVQTIDFSQNLGISGILPNFSLDSKLENLYVGSTNFSGTIPSSISNLRYLKKLDLGTDGLSGILPSSIGELKSLELLHVSGFQLEGSIPSWISNLTSLTALQLSDCGLSGPVPSSIGKLRGLTSLALYGCNFWGKIPPQISNLTQLQTLLLHSNNFVGTVQLSSFSKMQNLTVLNLSNNELHVVDGENSSSLGFFPKIEFLRLASCKISSFPNILRHLDNINSLDLSGNQIHGEIPWWAWENWKGKHMFLLNISQNNFTSIGSGPLLPLHIEYFDLSFNNFNGPIPVPQNGSVMLDYSSNHFSSMPPDYSNYLFDTIYFKASRNNLSGNITSLICGIAGSMQLIDLSYNNISGSIPSCFLEDVSTLQVLSLKENMLSGVLPDNTKKGCALEAIDFSGNLIEGKIPRFLDTCKNMEILDFGSNQISDTFPCWMSTLPKLQVLVLKSNKFTGQLLDPLYNAEDRNKCQFTELRIVDIASNNFSGPLPEGWFKMLKSMKAKSDNGTLVMENQYTHGQTYQFTAALTYKGYDITMIKILRSLVLIDISNNRFHGTIPEAIGELVLLRGLNMSHNALTGPIPSQFGNLKQLESLDLSSNELSGEIPQNLASLNFLSTLNLSYNMLTGRIPDSAQFCTFPYSSYLGNIGLCGPQVSKQCSNQSEKGLMPYALEQYSLDPLLFVFTSLGFGVCFSITVIVIWGSPRWQQS